MADDSNTGGNTPGGKSQGSGTKVTTTKTSKTQKTVSAGNMQPKPAAEQSQAEKPKAREPAKGTKSESLAKTELTVGLKLQTLYKNREATEKKIQTIREKLANIDRADLVGLEILNRQLKEQVTQEKRLGDTITAVATAAAKIHRERQVALVKERTELVETWKSTTLLGKAYSGLTSGLGRLTAGVTAGGLAMQGLQRFQEAALLRQQIQINQYKNLEEGVTSSSKAVDENAGFFSKLFDSADKATGGVLKSADAAWKSSAANAKLSEELAKAKSSAILLGQDTEAVTGIMAHFAQVTGSDNPKALRILTEGAMGVSRTLGITTSESLDFVATRMQKFGGSAADALVDLQGMRDMVGRTNETFGKTVIRGDDLVRTIQDISQESSVYAIDQKYVSNIMLTSVTRLQALGQSYDEAKNKAKLFAETLTGKNAPEFMQALAGQKLTAGISKSLKGVSHSEIMKNGAGAAKDYMKKYGDALNKAAPGLADRVAKIATDPRMDLYSKQRVIQQMTAGTSVGAEFMAREQEKVIKQVGRSPVVIAELYGVTIDAAQGIIDANDGMVKQLKERDDLEKASVETLMKRFGITKENAEAIKGDKDALLDILQSQEKSKLITDAQAAAEKKRTMARETMAALDEKILRQEAAIAAETDETRKKRLQEATNALKAQRAEAEAGSYASKEDWLKDIEKKTDALEKSLTDANISPDERKKIEAALTKLRDQKLEIETKDLTPGDKQLIRLQEGTKKILGSFEKTNNESGRTMLSIYKEMGTFQNLLAGATAFGGTIAALKLLGIDMKFLISAVLKNKGGGAGGGGGADGPGADGPGPGPGEKGKRKGTWREKMKGGAGRAAMNAASSIGAPLAAGAIMENVDSFEDVGEGTKSAVLGLTALAGSLGPIGGLAATAAVGLFAVLDKLGVFEGLANLWEGKKGDSKEVLDAMTNDMAGALNTASKKMGLGTIDGDKANKLAIKQEELKKKGVSDEKIWAELVAELKDLSVRQIRGEGRGETDIQKAATGMGKADRIEKIQKTEEIKWDEAQEFIKKASDKKAKTPTATHSASYASEMAKAQELADRLTGKGTPSSLGTQTPVPKPLSPAVQPQPGAQGQVPNQMPVSPAAAMAPTATPTNAPPANATIGDSSMFGVSAAPGGGGLKDNEAVPAPGASPTTASVAPGGQMTGAFQGGIGGDGSIILRVDNAREFFASGAAQAKGGVQTTNG